MSDINSFKVNTWISILYIGWFYAFCRLSEKAKIYSAFLYILVQLNTFIIIFLLDIYNTLK